MARISRPLPVCGWGKTAAASAATGEQAHHRALDRPVRRWQIRLVERPGSTQGGGDRCSTAVTIEDACIDIQPRRTTGVLAEEAATPFTAWSILPCQPVLLLGTAIAPSATAASTVELQVRKSWQIQPDPKRVSTHRMRP
jgi:hypothetical protein